MILPDCAATALDCCCICFSARARLLFSFSFRCALMCALNADLFSAKFCPQIVHLESVLGDGDGDGAGLITSDEDVEDDNDRGDAFFLLAAVAPSVTDPGIFSWSPAVAALATPEIWRWP